MIHIKPSVIFHPDTFCFPMCQIVNQAQALAPSGYDITITSACDGTHKENSKHYKGRAFDFRTNDLPEGSDVKVWAKRLQNRLGDSFFVLIEATHMHVQFNG